MSCTCPTKERRRRCRTSPAAMCSSCSPKVPATKALIEGGKVRALGVTTLERVAALPDVPPLAEVGIPNYNIASLALGLDNRRRAEGHRRQARERDSRGDEHAPGAEAACCRRRHSADFAAAGESSRNSSTARSHAGASWSRRPVSCKPISMAEATLISRPAAVMLRRKP